MLKHLLAGAASLVAATAANAETYAIQAGRLIVDASQPARGNATVIVENGRVSRIDNGFTAPAGAIVVDERNQAVLVQRGIKQGTILVRTDPDWRINRFAVVDAKSMIGTTYEWSEQEGRLVTYAPTSKAIWDEWLRAQVQSCGRKPLTEVPSSWKASYVEAMKKGCTLPHQPD